MADKILHFTLEYMYKLWCYSDILLLKLKADFQCVIYHTVNLYKSKIPVLLTVPKNIFY